jgi:hypothetical protein
MPAEIAVAKTRDYDPPGTRDAARVKITKVKIGG